MQGYRVLGGCNAGGPLRWIVHMRLAAAGLDGDGSLAPLEESEARHQNSDAAGATSEQSADDHTAARAVVTADSDEPREKLQRTLDRTMSACPVGKLYEKAGILIQTQLTVNRKR